MSKYNVPDLVRRYQSGESTESIARSLGVNGCSIRFQLRKAGVEILDNKVLADKMLEERSGMSVSEAVDEMARLYRDGLGMVKIGERFGITKPSVVKRLRERGIEIRTVSEAAKLRFADMSEEERQAVTKAANASVRGVPQSEEHRTVVARTRESRRTSVSPLEIEFAALLSDRNVPTIPQKAVGRYNIDLAVEETAVAVEIFGGNWHNFGASADRYRQRLDYLLNRGWLPVIIWHTPETPLGEGAADYVVALHEACRRGEADRSQERVIRGNGYSAPVGESDVSDRPVKPPLRRRPDSVGPDSRSG